MTSEGGLVGVAGAFEIVKEEQLFKRFLRINDRVVKYPNGQEIKFDILCGRSNKFVTILPFFSETKEFAMIREYCQGINDFSISVACGGFEEGKHSSIQHAAECELSEESGLRGGTWIRLVEEGHPGVMEAKWAATRFTPFLVIDPEKDPAPLSMDAEEHIERLRMKAEVAESAAYAGSMHLPSSLTLLMGIKVLRDKGLL